MVTPETMPQVKMITSAKYHTTHKVSVFPGTPHRFNPSLKREVGKIYWCNYWKTFNTVLDLGPGGQVTEVGEDNLIRRHCTPLSNGDGVVIDS